MNNYSPISEGLQDKLVDQMESMCPALDFKTRVIGFIVCSGIGWFLTIYSLFSILSIAMGNAKTFAILFSISQVLNIAGLCFMSGPKAQVRGLKKPGRLVAAILFYLAILGTLLVSLMTDSFILTLLMVMILLSSYVWYTCTLFPWGQRVCKGCLKNMCFGQKE